MKDAFYYFTSFGANRHAIYKQGYEQAMDNLFPKRFTQKDKDTIWTMVSSGGVITQEQFAKLFNQAEFTGNVSLNG